MAILRFKVHRRCPNKRLLVDEEIYTPKMNVRNNYDRNVRIPCALCGDTVLMGTSRASSFDNKKFEHIFCSALCKLKSLIKNRDPQKCWLFTRPGFVWDQRMFSIRIMCYEIHTNENCNGRELISTCGQKRCNNPLHIQKKDRKAIRLDE